MLLMIGQVAKVRSEDGIPPNHRRQVPLSPSLPFPHSSLPADQTRAGLHALMNEPTLVDTRARMYDHWWGVEIVAIRSEGDIRG